jgi:fused signal recognition particle receptor
MFSFFKKKTAPTPASDADAATALPPLDEAMSLPSPAAAVPPDAPQVAGSWWKSTTAAVAKLVGATAEPVEMPAAAPAATLSPDGLALAPAAPPSAASSRQSWLEKLRSGLRKTGSSIA